MKLLKQNEQSALARMSFGAAASRIGSGAALLGTLFMNMGCANSPKGVGKGVLDGGSGTAPQSHAIQALQDRPELSPTSVERAVFVEEIAHFQLSCQSLATMFGAYRDTVNRKAQLENELEKAQLLVDAFNGVKAPKANARIPVEESVDPPQLLKDSSRLITESHEPDKVSTVIGRQVASLTLEIRAEYFRVLAKKAEELIEDLTMRTAAQRVANQNLEKEVTAKWEGAAADVARVKRTIDATAETLHRHMNPPPPPPLSPEERRKFLELQR